MHRHSALPSRIALLMVVAAALAIAVIAADQHRRAATYTALPVLASAPPVAAGGSSVGGIAPTPELVSLHSTPRAAAARPCEKAQVIATVDRELPIRQRPGAGAVIGTVPATSLYLHNGMHAWIRNVSADGRFGEVTVPWRSSPRSGWVDLRGLATTTTSISVRADLSKRELEVWDACRVVLRAPMAIGAASSPSPVGRFWVTDPIAVPASQPQFGSFAFGISAVQPNPPPGWTGGNQMAIHGTNDPGSIGTPASAGCLRVSEATLGRLRSLLVPGTPVIIVA